MTEIELRQKEDELFLEWRNHIPHRSFVKDGIADFDAYFRTKPRIAFLLKEPNWEDAGEWEDMREGLSNGGWKGWSVVVRWINAILAGEQEWATISDVSKKFRQEQLRKVAVVDIKKSGGTGSSNMDILRDYAKDCGQFAFRQIELYKPNLLICGNVGDIAYEHIFKHVAGKWFLTSRGAYWFRLSAWPCVVIDYYHYAAHIRHSLLHYGLVDACLEILKALHDDESFISD